MTKFLLTTSHFDGDFPPVVSHDIKGGNKRLLVCYDLNNCLSNLESDIDGYDDILDIYLLESIHHLGKYHQKYFEGEQEIVSYGLRKYISESSIKHPVDLNGDLGISRDFWPRLLDYAGILRKHVMTAGVWDHYQDVELPFSLALHTLTSNGVTFDPVTLQTIREKTERAHQKILYALDVNNVSGGQIKDLNDWVRGYGFGEFFPVGRDEISIKDLSLLEDQHQVFKIFVRLDKLKRVNSFLNSIGHKRTIRPFYKTMGAVTSRCTSTNPNIMGVPKIFRPVVVPSRTDFGIVECDYSQMEVGVAAALAEDQNLIEDFNTTDVYEKAGELLFGKSGDGSRSKAKIIFLGIQYGLSRKTIARRLEITEKKAARILASLYGRYGNLKMYLASLERAGKENGYVENISGLRRYRRYPERVPNYWERNWFKNFPVQSSAASVFKKAIIKMYRELKHEPFHLLVPLYDSVVFECPLNRIQEITKVVEGCMITSMREYFPKLKPKVSINNSDPGCWNSEGKSNSIEKFLDNPLFDIDIREKPSSNVDWSSYLQLFQKAEDQNEIVVNIRPDFEDQSNKKELHHKSFLRLQPNKYSKIQNFDSLTCGGRKTMHEDDRIRKIEETKRRIKYLGRQLGAQVNNSTSLRGDLYYAAPMFQQFHSECRELEQLKHKKPFEPKIVLRKKRQSKQS